MEEIKVELGERSYAICVGSDILGEVGERLQAFRFSRVSVISNPTVVRLWGDQLLGSLQKAYPDVAIVIVPDGEEYKELLWAYYVYGELLRHKLDRASAVIALGGGVIGDLTGFVASTYMRGISFIQVPTTLLAQVDSSVGGKTGVNHALAKNVIGTFYQPRLVWGDVSTLMTLPKRELLTGIAEVIKYGVIWDKELFQFLAENREKILNREIDVLRYIIKRSCEIKAEVVSKDEREGGLRAILNYGHTFGHAIETATGYRTYLHGEAVAVGMCLEARLSLSLGIMGEEEVERIHSLINAYGLPTKIPSDIDRDQVLSAMQLDKKTIAGELKFVLPEKIGSVEIVGVSDTTEIAVLLRSD
ncbi:MAG TPA: 3-dehydroquinate synthase [Nitrospiraceae bacterium]|nr:3-dehydroquinate synthase [Nitrospiraceae bacterium]